MEPPGPSIRGHAARNLDIDAFLAPPRLVHSPAASRWCILSWAAD